MDKKIILILLSASNFHLGFAMEQTQERKNTENSSAEYNQLLKKMHELPKDIQNEILKHFIESKIKNDKDLIDVQDLEKISKNVKAIVHSEPFKSLIAKKRFEILKLIQDQLNKVGIDIDIRKNINNQDIFGYTALMRAALCGYPGIMEQLINNDPTRGNYSLMEAISKNITLTQMSLIEAGVDLNRQNKYGITALILAINKGHTKIAMALIKAGADVNKQDEYGDTALMLAALRGYIEIVEALINAGSNVNLENKDRWNALFFARGHKDITDLLKAHGAITEKDEIQKDSLKPSKEQDFKEQKKCIIQ